MPRKKTTTKKAARKRTAKKAAKRVVKPAIAKDTAAFNLLGSDILSKSREVLLDLATKKTSFLPSISMDDGKGYDPMRHILEIPNLAFQHLISARGFRKASMVDIIGEKGIGKTSLALTLAGMFALKSTPTLIIESEGKPPDEERILQCLSPSLETATQIRSNAVQIQPARNLQDMYILIVRWIEVVRKAGLPLNIPVFVVVDTFSKLMGNTEAQINGFYTKSVKKTKLDQKKADLKVADLQVKGAENLLSVTKFEHAAFAQRLTRLLPDILERYNVVLMFIRHQNDPKINPVPGSLPVAKRNNAVSIGGRAIPQSAALQLIVTSAEAAKRGDELVGQNVNINIHKNNYGPGDCQIQYMVNWKDYPHTDPDRQTPAITFAPYLAWRLSTLSILGVRQQSKWEFSSQELGLRAVDPDTLLDYIQADPELMAIAGRALGVKGYALPEPIQEEMTEDGSDSEESEPDSGASVEPDAD